MSAATGAGPMPTASPRLGNLVGALAIHSLLLFYGGLWWVGFALAGVGGTELVLGGAVGAAVWLGLAGLVARWWIRGRPELWNVTLAWLAIVYLFGFTFFALPLLLWTRFRRWLGGSLRPWRPAAPA